MKENVEIDNSFVLPPSNFFNKKTVKKKILLADTFDKEMNHYRKWLVFNNGNYKAVSHFSITKEGVIYKHVDPSFCTNYINSKDNEEFIFILLENVGWLNKVGDNYVDWGDNVFEGNVYEQKWRNNKYWDQYSDKQIDSTVKLIDKIIENNNIKPIIKNNSFLSFNGDENIYYKSNLSRSYKDINPSWDFSKIKQIQDEK